MKAKKVPLVSVVVSTYNGEKTIGECIESLVEQDYPKDRYEIIVVNDGSTDSTRDILEKYPVKVIEHKENLGLASARNTGIRNSRGDIIAFTDDDCVASQRWIANLVEKYDDYDVWGVGGLIKPQTNQSVFEKYVSLSRNPVYSHTKVIKSGERIKDYLRSMIAGAPRFSDGDILTGIMGCNSSYRRDAIEKVGLFNTKFKRRGDDWDFSVRLKKAGCVLKYSKGATIYHRHREDMLSFIKHAFKYGRDSILVSKTSRIMPVPYPLPILFLLSLPLILVKIDFVLIAGGILGISLVKELPHAIKQKDVRMIVFLPLIENIREFAYSLGIIYGLIKYSKPESA